MNLLIGTQATDLGPFRAVTAAALRRLDMQDRNFGWTVEMQIKAARAGLRVREVPVDYRPRIGRSKVSGTVSGTIRADAVLVNGSWELAGIARLGQSDAPLAGGFRATLTLVSGQPLRLSWAVDGFPTTSSGRS